MNLILVKGPQQQLQLPGSMVSPAVSLAGVDWDHEVAVVVDMGEQRTGGYAVSVQSARVTGPDRIELSLHVQRPGPGMFVTQAFTHPHAVARVARAGLGKGPVTVVAYDQSQTEVARRVVSL
ncbi:MAG: protease complex subunit PrcB family protein [Bacillota bacterium]